MDIKYSFILTFISGFSTMFGFLIIFLKNKKTEDIINCSLSFASGVMISVSIFDLIPGSYNVLVKTHNVFCTITIVMILNLIGFFIGNLIDKIDLKKQDNLYKIGIISFFIIVLHNIPEGIITFMSSSINKKLGKDITISIMLHNIPEGVIIAMPIYHSSKNKLKTFLYTLLASMSEPFGALLSYLFLSKYINSNFISILFSLISGLMLYISIFELIKETIKYKKYTKMIVFIIIGVLLMAFNIYFL